MRLPSRFKRFSASAPEVRSRTEYGCVLPGLGLACSMAPGTYYPGLSSIAAKRSHPLPAGQGLGLQPVPRALGACTRPPPGGAMVDRAGYGPGFLSAALSMAAGTCMFLFLSAARDQFPA